MIRSQTKWEANDSLAFDCLSLQHTTIFLYYLSSKLEMHLCEHFLIYSKKQLCHKTDKHPRKCLSYNTR